jgi:hypothetical protein
MKIHIFCKLLSPAITCAIVAVPSLVWSQPLPNSRGDYAEGDWNPWLVVDRDFKGLNCRRDAGTNYRVVKKFYNNKKLYVFTQGDEDLIRYDREGKAWLAVLPDGYQYSTPCYVRANNRFIQPIPQ